MALSIWIKLALAYGQRFWHNRPIFSRKEVPLEAPITVCLPSALVSRTGSRRRVNVSAGTVREAIETLEHQYPGLRFHICHETGELRPFVNIFVEGENVRFLQGLDTPISSGNTLHVIHSVAGG